MNDELRQFLFTKEPYINLNYIFDQYKKLGQIDSDLELFVSKYFALQRTLISYLALKVFDCR